MNAGSDLEVASRFSVSPRTLLDEFPGISSCRSWTRVLTLCSLGFDPDSAVMRSSG